MQAYVSVIIPVFNSGAGLPQLAERISASLAGKVKAFEVIMVDDCSQDNSWEVITSLAKRYDWLAGARLAHNTGQYAATLTGLGYARHPVAVTLDDDLQHPPEAICELLAALTQDIDIVYAKPQIPMQNAVYRSVVAATKYLISILCGAPFLCYVRSFRALRTSLYPWRRVPEHTLLSPDSLLKHVKPRVRVVSVTYDRRKTGRSTYTWKLSAQLLLMIWRGSRIAYPPEGNSTPELSGVAGWLAQSQSKVAVG